MTGVHTYEYKVYGQEQIKTAVLAIPFEESRHQNSLALEYI